MNPFEISINRFNEFASEYTEIFRNVDSYCKYLNKFCELIKTQNCKILELACGPGNVTKYVKSKLPDSQYIAIDIAPAMIEIAKKEVNDVDFRVMDIRDILGLSHHFDAIICSFGLPFLSKADTYTLIKDCSQLLLPNGVIYISTMEGTDSMAGFEPTSFSGDSKVYFNYHNQKDIEFAFESNNLIINYLDKQDYPEPNGNILIDLVFIGTKKSTKKF